MRIFIMVTTLCFSVNFSSVVKGDNEKDLLSGRYYNDGLVIPKNIFIKKIDKKNYILFYTSNDILKNDHIVYSAFAKYNKKTLVQFKKCDLLSGVFEKSKVIFKIELNVNRLQLTILEKSDNSGLRVIKSNSFKKQNPLSEKEEKKIEKLLNEIERKEKEINEREKYFKEQDELLNS